MKNMLSLVPIFIIIVDNNLIPEILVRQKKNNRKITSKSQSQYKQQIKYL